MRDWLSISITKNWDLGAPGLRENWGNKTLCEKRTMIVQKKILLKVIGIEHMTVTVMVGGIG